MTTKQQNIFNTLLVEDIIYFREVLKSVICNRFPLIRVNEADNGKIALKIIATHTPDLIFMDIKLPGENGIQLTKDIKTEFHNIVIVVLSNYDLPEYRQAAFRNGADCFIAKESISCMEDVLARVEGTIASKMHR